jgi:hypothetical protein
MKGQIPKITGTSKISPLSLRERVRVRGQCYMITRILIFFQTISQGLPLIRPTATFSLREKD